MSVSWGASTLASRARKTGSMLAPSLYTGMTTLRRGPTSHAPRCQLLLDPRDDLVQHLVQTGGGLEAEDLTRLAHIWDAALHVVLVGRVMHDPQCTVPVDFPPHDLGEFEHRGADRGRQVEVFINRLGRLDAQSDASSQVASIWVV